jgi:hypothetical protein
MAFAADGRVLAAMTQTSDVKVWRQEEATTRFREILSVRHPGTGDCGASLSADGRFLTTHSSDGSVRVWNLVTATTPVNGIRPAEMLNRLRGLDRGTDVEKLDPAELAQIAAWATTYRTSLISVGESPKP